jgi:hypothetical protein
MLFAIIEKPKATGLEGKLSESEAFGDRGSM